MGKKKTYLCGELSSETPAAQFTEDVLIDQLKLFNRLAQTEFFRRWFKRIYSHVRKKYARRSSIEDSEEITSAALFTVMVWIEQFRGESSFVTWIFAHAKNRSFDLYSRPGLFPWIRKPGGEPVSSKKRDKRNYSATADVYNSAEVRFKAYDDLFSYPSDKNDPLGRANDPIGDADEQLEDLRDQYELDLIQSGLAREEQELYNEDRLDREILKLGSDKYIVLKSIDVKGLSYEETARWLGRTPEAIRKLYKRAKKKLQAQLEVDPHFQRLLARTRQSTFNYQGNEQIQDKQTGEHPAEFEADEKQKVPYVEFTTFETFFNIYDSQGGTHGEWLSALKNLSKPEIEKWISICHLSIESTIQNAARIRKNAQLANSIPERTRSPRKKEVLVNPIKISFHIKDVLIAKAILPREEDGSVWMDATDFFWLHKELEWKVLDSIDEIEIPLYFTKALKSSLVAHL